MLLLLLLQEDRENILRSRATGKAVLTRPFRPLDQLISLLFYYSTVELPVHRHLLPTMLRIKKSTLVVRTAVTNTIVLHCCYMFYFTISENEMFTEVTIHSAILSTAVIKMVLLYLTFLVPS